MTATPIPDWRHELDEGIRYQRAGAPDRALQIYAEVVAGAGDPALVSEALRRQSDVYRMRADWNEAISAARQAAEIAAAAGLQELRADALNTEAGTHFYKGDFATAVPLLDRVLELSTDDLVRGAALQNLGAIAARNGDFDAAEARFLESYRCYHGAGHLRGEILALQNYGGVALDRKNYELAANVLRQAVTAARKLNDLDLLAMTNVNYAEALAGQREFARAIDCASTALGFFTVVDNRLWRVKCLRLLGDLYVERGEYDIARRCYERGAGIAEEIDARPDAERIAERMKALSDKE